MSNTNPVTVESINPQDAKLEALRSLFPEVFREGKLDNAILSATLGESISNEQESYGMSWAGKSDARKQIVTPTTNTLSPDEASSVDFANTDNIFIEGDNLEILKLLQKSYTKQVKMIYIDPPYNTGKDFVYHDNFHTSTREYEEASGQRDSEGSKFVQNTETNGRYHSDWLSMIYPRLHLARNLLRDDGVIFVSIDDHEVYNLRKVMTEVFGEENFLEQFIWKNGRTSASIYTREHEYILCFARNIENTKFIKYNDIGDDNISDRAIKKIGEKNPASNIDFPAGIRFEGPDATFPEVFGDTESVEVIEGVFECKNGILLNPVTLRAGWTMKDMIESWLTGDEVIDSKGQRVLEFYFKQNGVLNYIKERGSIHPKTIINDFTTKQGTKEIVSLFGKPIFSFPKPTRLLEFLLQFTTNDDLILDFFAGSGTTGHSVMALNTEEKTEAVKNGLDPNAVGNRRYICVQLDEATDKKSEAYKAGYMTISEITAERLRRAGKKIKEENPNVSFDSGFRLYRLTPSCYQVASVEYDSEDSQTTLESLERAIQSGISPLRDGVNEADVIVENLIKEGFLLNSRLENIKIGDNHFLYTEREGKRIYMSFESDISMSTIQSLSRDYSEAIFVVHDNALDDSRKVMMSDRVKLRTI